MPNKKMSELKVMTLNQKNYVKRNAQAEKLRRARARKRAKIRRRKRIIRLTCVLSGLLIFLIVVLCFLLFKKESTSTPIAITAVDIEQKEINLSPVTIIPAQSEENTMSSVKEIVVSADTPEPVATEEIATQSPMYNIPISDDLQQYIYEVAKEYDVDVALIIAVMDHESDFNPNARSESGDSGLMQVNDINLETLREELGIEDIFDPYQNVLGGTYLLSKCLKDANGEIHPALMCYNMGRSNAKECWSKGIYSSKYSRAVYSLYENEYQR